MDKTELITCAANNSNRNTTVCSEGGQTASPSKAAFTAGMRAQHLSRITRVGSFSSNQGLSGSRWSSASIIHSSIQAEALTAAHGRTVIHLRLRFSETPFSRTSQFCAGVRETSLTTSVSPALHCCIILNMLGNVNYMDGMMYNVWIQVQYALWVIEK